MKTNNGPLKIFAETSLTSRPRCGDVEKKLLVALSPLNCFGLSPEFPLPIQVVSSFLLTQTNRFVSTYKRKSPFDKVLCVQFLGSIIWFCIDSPENKGKMLDLYGENRANPE